jgi:hypothetical protein
MDTINLWDKKNTGSIEREAGARQLDDIVRGAAPSVS